MPVSNVNDVIFDRMASHHVRLMRVAEASCEHVLQLLTACDNDTIQACNDHANIEVALRAADKINTRVYQKIGTYLRSRLNEVAEYEVEFGQDLLNTHLPFAYAVKRPAKAYVRAIIDEEPLYGGLFDEWVEGLKQGRFQRLRSMLRMAFANNESTDEVADRIRGRRFLGYRDGTSAVNARSARGLVVTSINSVANRARTDFCKANGDIIAAMMWSALLDDVTCEACAALDGEYFDPDEVENPPSLHINCRCVLIPIIADDDEDWQIPPPKKLTYEKWLSQQSAAFQDELLGPARAAMFRRGLPLKKFSDSSGLRYNLSELRNIEALTMAKKTKTAGPSPRTNVKVLRNYGWKPDVPDQRDKLFGVAHPQEVQLPVKVSLRDRFNFGIFDQGELGSCVANACVAQHMFVHQGEQMMSRLDLYWSARWLEGMVEYDSGVMIRDGVKALQKFGVCTEKMWPYKIRKFAVDPPAKADAEALRYRITSYSRLTGLAEFQRCLAAGYPFVFGFSVYENINDAACDKYGVLMMPTKNQQMLGGHAVLAVGYDTDFHNNAAFKRSGLSTDSVPAFMFECRNSWGADWGDAGHFWLPADYVNDRNLSDDFWTIRD